MRPLASDALAPGLPYADRIDLAGWLVAEYQKRGGDELDQFIADRCGAERSVYLRLERVREGLRPLESPVTISEEAGAFVPVSPNRATKLEVPAAAGTVSGEPGRDGARGDEVLQATTAGPLPPPAREQDRQAGEPDRHGQEPDRTAARPAREVVAPPEAERAGSPEPRPPADPLPAAGSQHAPPQAGPAEFVPVPSPQQRVEDPPREASSGFEPIHDGAARGPYDDQAYYADQGPRRGEGPPPAGEEPIRPLAPSREGTPPPLSVLDRTGRQPDTAYQGERYPHPLANATVSQLLTQLELVGNDAGQFNSILRRIFDTGIHPDNHKERAKSWEIISEINWYNHVSEHWDIQLDALARIFDIVVIPDFTGQVAAEVIARWAWGAPPPMIGGLLAAARNADLDMWHAMMHILEPVIAARWVIDNSIHNYWDPERMSRGAADYGGGDNRRRGIRGLLRH